MALAPETGAGVAGADSYASQTAISAYWTARPHNALATVWSGATSANKDGAAREATAYIDATWGAYFKGARRGYVQGLLWPRTGATDEAGYPLPDLPPELLAAVSELAARAVSAVLAADIDTAGQVSEETVGPITTKYFAPGSATAGTSYGIVAGLLAPLLNGSQPNAPSAKWAWA